MIRSIVLENFMSHGQTRIELSDGLTVLTGPNNCGKSALVAALQILAAGGKTTHVMRHGAKRCRVTVQTDDGQTVIWERKKTTVKYNINGEDIHRTGQGIPDNLHDVLKLDRVVTKVGAGEETYDIHFGQQKSPVFLLDQPGSKSAAFFASSSDASRLIEMQGRHRKQLSERRAELKRIDKELSEVTERLSGFDPIDTIAGHVEKAETKRAELERSTQRLAKLQRTIDTLRAAVQSLDRLRKRCGTLRKLDQASTSPTRLAEDQAVTIKLRSNLRSTRQAITEIAKNRSVRQSLSDLRPAPQLGDCRPIAMLISRLTQTQRERNRASVIRDRCQSLRPAPDLADTRRLSAVLGKIVAARKSLHVVRSQHQAIAGLCQPPVGQATESLGQNIRRMRTAELKCQSMRRWVGTFDDLRPPPTPVDVQPMQRIAARMLPVIRQQNAARQALAAARRDLKDCRHAIDAFVERHPKCETCGGRIDPETLMSTLPHDDGTGVVHSTSWESA